MIADPMEPNGRPYSSTTSGRRPGEEARIASLVASTPPAPAPEPTPYYDPEMGTTVVAPAFDGEPITEPWPGMADDPGSYPEPEDRGYAERSEVYGVDYVTDLVRPGRITLVAAEEGTGKSFALLELAIRVAVAGGSFAGTWPVGAAGPVLYLSEMHADDDLDREEAVLAALGHERADLRGRLHRLSLATAAGGLPVLTTPDWLDHITGWLAEHACIVMIVDTATVAAQIDPWGRELHRVFAGLRAMLAACPSLAILPAVHLRKPAGRGDRGLADVLGEWGRWSDVVLLMENEGGLTRVRLTARKRVRHERRIVATKFGGLLVDPVDLDTATGPKVPVERVMAAIGAHPGITYAGLGAVLDVSKDTAHRYVDALGDRVIRTTGPNRATLLRAAPGAAVPQGAAGTAAAPGAGGPEAAEGVQVPHAARTYIGAAVRAAAPDPAADAPVPLPLGWDDDLAETATDDDGEGWA